MEEILILKYLIYILFVFMNDSKDIIVLRLNDNLILNVVFSFIVEFF